MQRGLARQNGSATANAPDSNAQCTVQPSVCPARLQEGEFLQGSPGYCRCKETRNSAEYIITAWLIDAGGRDDRVDQAMPTVLVR